MELSDLPVGFEAAGGLRRLLLGYVKLVLGLGSCVVPSGPSCEPWHLF